MIAKYSSERGIQCSNSCGAANDGDYDFRTGKSKKAVGDTWAYPFFAGEYLGLADRPNLEIPESTEIDLDDGSHLLYQGNWTSGLAPGAMDLTVDHCLVEPVDRVCYVGLSNTLLLAVTICVLTKTITAVVVTITLGRYNQEPLVTLGDAIASFIRRPDSTRGMCTIGQMEMRRSHNYATLAGPRRWQGSAHRLWNTIPRATWIWSYVLFSISIITIASCFFSAYSERGL
jgi:hypothetical protein